MLLNVQSGRSSARHPAPCERTLPNRVDGTATAGEPSEESIEGVSETEMIFFALAQAVEQRDLHTASHCERLAFISVAMGMIAGIEGEGLMTLHRGGYMHDIGKVGIPD